MGKRIAVILVLMVLVIISGIGWQIYNTKPSGLAAKDFTIPLMQQDGTLTLSDYRGKVVVMNFWASWCTPCREEAPRLQDVWEEYQDQDVVFIGVNSHETSDEDALAFLEEFGITYLNVNDADEEVAKLYNVYALPVTAIIDEQGYIREVFFRSPARAELREAIEKWLND